MTMPVEEIARICHEINRAYCAAIGDTSQVPWKDAPEWQRESAIDGVNFRIANPTAPPSANHESWLEKKKADGWSYGPVKNPGAKEHPCLLPFNELPKEQQVKDHLFIAVVDAFRETI